MKLAPGLLVVACLLAVPVAAQVQPERSLDAADTGKSHSLDADDKGRSHSPVPDATGEDPDDAAGSQAEQAGDSESLDAADTGTAETSDQVEAADAQAAAAAPPPLGPPPPIEDGNFDAQSAAAAARVVQAQSNLDYWERAYADMIRLDRPTGAARVALVDSRTRAQADLASAKSQAGEIASRAAAAGRPLD